MRPDMKNWDLEEDERMRTDYLAGLSCSIIGLRLNRTRNSIIGRIRRLGIKRIVAVITIKPVRIDKESVIKLAKITKDAAEPRMPAPVRGPKPRLISKWLPHTQPMALRHEPPPLDGVPYDEMTGDGRCQYPYGHQPPFTWCGKPTVRKSSWCEHHNRIVFVPNAYRRNS